MDVAVSGGGPDYYGGESRDLTVLMIGAAYAL